MIYSGNKIILIFIILLPACILPLKAEVRAPGFIDMVFTRTLQGESGTCANQEDETNSENGAVVEINGSICSRDEDYFIRKQSTGESILLIDYDFSRLKNGQTVTLEGISDLSPSVSGEPIPSLRGPFRGTAGQALPSKFKQSSTVDDLSSDYYSPAAPDIVFPAQVRDAGERFISAWEKYVTDVRKTVDSKQEAAFKDKYGKALPPYQLLNRINKEAYALHSKDFDRAVELCNLYIRRCEEQGIWSSTDDHDTYFYLEKERMLLRILARNDNTTLLAVPFACGANPDFGHKQRSGDFRTPETPLELCSLEKTPFFVTRRVPYTAKAGMTVRVIGIGSTRPEDKFWVAHGMRICIHGTPANWSMGLAASHGCCRVREEHAPYVYDLTNVNTPIVIRPRDRHAPPARIQETD